MKNFVIFVVLLGLLGVGANGAYNWYSGQQQPVSSHSVKVAFHVSDSEGSTAIGDDLFAKGLIRSREVWQVYVRLNNLAPSFQAGDFVLDKSWSMSQIATALQHAHSAEFAFTIPEGYTIGRAAQKWQSEGHGSAQDYVSATDPANWQQYDFVKNLPQVPGRVPGLEGYLLPETYSLSKGATAKDLVKAQLDEFQAVMTPDLQAKARAEGFTLDQLVVLASMVDREVQSDPNRAIVCGIMMNRLATNNALDVDATVLYALGRTTGPQDLSQQDLNAAAGNPYDTYTHPGLPPGPISNPGKAAINACVNPQQRDQHYLFYFADCNGKTHFATNEAQFEEQIRQYGVVGNGC